MLAPGKPVRTAVLLPMVMTRPPCPMWAAAAWMATTTPRTLTARMWSRSSNAVFQDAAVDQHAGIDHEDVEATELLHGFRHGAAQLGLITAVRLDGDGAHAARRNLVHQFMRLVRRGAVGQGEAAAIFRQTPRDAVTD